MTAHAGDPLDSHLTFRVDDDDLDDLLAALQYPEDPTVPGLTPTQLRAALRALHNDGRYPDEDAYSATSETRPCPTCGTAVGVTVETGPDFATGDVVAVTRWARHAHPATGLVCHPLATWEPAAG